MPDNRQGKLLARAAGLKPAVKKITSAIAQDEGINEETQQ
jgi:hypothetical protein